MENKSGIKIFKFGGASVHDAESIRNIAAILSSYAKEKIVIVISAMGKTTNELEKLAYSYFHKNPDVLTIFSAVKEYHYSIMKDLFSDANHPVFLEVNNSFVEIEWILEEVPKPDYDFVYDQIVSVGELVSTKIVSAFLASSGILNQWLDARDVICTDNTYREGKIDWNVTLQKCQTLISLEFQKNNFVLTQGFIGSTSENYTTTLGREGSDYTAAILAYCLDADDVVIWKNVPGVLNADPKFFKDTQHLKKVSYTDAIELAYYGASVIHPKTIQPLQNKNISLHVKSFIHPKEDGTIISPESQTEPIIPSFIFKDNQLLVSISAKDFSFIAEEHLRDIFKLFSTHRVKINLMQNSAISFSVCLDNDAEKIPQLIKELTDEYTIRYNENLILYTIRHYDDATIKKLIGEKEILLEQRSRHTVQLVVKT